MDLGAVDRRAVDLRAVRAVLLDMDGTLVDSDAAVERAWTTWAVEHGVAPADVLTVAHGNPAPTTVRLVRPDLAEDAVATAAARQLSLQYDDLHDVTALAGAHDLIGLLDRLALLWAVVTSADRRLATARLDAAGLKPPLLLTVEDVTHGKPHPEGYRTAAERLGVAPQHCLVVEDSDPGVQAGLAAGMPVAALRGLDGPGAEEPRQLRIRDLRHLAHLLRQHRQAP